MLLLNQIWHRLDFMMSNKNQKHFLLYMLHKWFVLGVNEDLNLGLFVTNTQYMAYEDLVIVLVN